MNWLQKTVAKTFRLGYPNIATDIIWGREPPSNMIQDHEIVQSSSAVFACTNIRAKNLAKLPLRIYKRAKNGERIEVNHGALYDLLSSVNQFWTFKRLLRMTEMSLCTYGQSFWVLETGVKNRNSRQTRPREIWWAHPAKMKVLPDPDQYVKGFLYEDSSGHSVMFDPADVVWMKYDNPGDEWSGMSPLSAARIGIETAMSAQRANKAIFANGMQIAGVVGPADKNAAMTREQAEQVGQMLERRFRGADKAHRLAVLTQPISFTNLSLTPKDAEFLGLMAWGLREVAMVFGVPPELIGDHEHATYSNIESAEKAFWTDTLIPEANFIADEITEQLVKLFSDEADEVEFDTTDIETLQEDRSELITQITQLVGVGVPLNRVLQELAPRFLPPGQKGYPWGDVAWLSSGLVPIDKAPTGGDGTNPVAADQNQNGGAKPTATDGKPSKVSGGPSGTESGDVGNSGGSGNGTGGNNGGDVIDSGGVSNLIGSPEGEASGPQMADAIAAVTTSIRTPQQLRYRRMKR